MNLSNIYILLLSFFISLVFLSGLLLNGPINIEGYSEGFSSILLIANKGRTCYSLKKGKKSIIIGNGGSAVLEAFSDHGVIKKVIRLGIPDDFAEKYGSQDIIMAGFGLDPGNIVKTVKNCLTKKR